MTTAQPKKLLTAEDLFDLPDDGHLYELVKGELVRVPPSFFSSSMVATTLAILLGSFVRMHRLGVCGGEAGGVRTATNPDTVRAPDFTFISNERLPAGGMPHRYYPVAPDLVVEVVSPSDHVGAVLDKAYEYLAGGTRMVWVIDPGDRSVTNFRPDRRPVTLRGDAVLSGEDDVPGFTLPLAELWVGLAEQEPAP